MEDRKDVAEHSAAPTCYPSRFESLEFRRRFEAEGQRRMAAIEHLWRAGRDDTTVNLFLECWRRGQFASFEDMLCQLVLALVRQKVEFEKTAVKAMQLSPHLAVILKDG